MGISVTRHQHDSPLKLQGADGQQLIVQTGTLILDFQGVSDADWIRDRITFPVLTVDIAGTFGHRISASASSAPSSIGYFPLPGGGSQNLLAKGNAILGGWADMTSGLVQVGGPVILPVVGGMSQGLPGAGWAADRTRAQVRKKDIDLVVDVAVIGPASLMRLAYSLFVTVHPSLVQTGVVDRIPLGEG